VGNVVHSVASGAQNINALFFMLGWGWYGFHKKRAVTHYTKLVFLHPVGCVCHVVYSCASGARNVDALFFMLGRDRYRFNKKRAGTHYDELVFLYLVGYADHVVHSGAWGMKCRRTSFRAWVGLVRISQKE
jgi:hypothetical protein